MSSSFLLTDSSCGQLSFLVYFVYFRLVLTFHLIYFIYLFFFGLVCFFEIPFVLLEILHTALYLEQQSVTILEIILGIYTLQIQSNHLPV